MFKVKKFAGYQGPNKAKNGGIDFKNYTNAEGAYSDLARTTSTGSSRSRPPR